MFGNQYTARHRSMLGAIAQGRAEITCGRFPCLRVDGRWCDQTAVSDLMRGGLVRADGSGAIDSLVPAVLTSTGMVVLASAAVAA